MKRIPQLNILVLLVCLAAPMAHAEEDGYTSLFDGKTLKNWDGNPKFWSVEEGAITGQTTKENPTKGNTFIIWRGGELGDFELKLEYRIVNGNSGIQYRSFEVEGSKWVVGGYQGDFEAGDTYSGILYGERFRGILANRGQKTVIGDNHKPKVVGSVGDSKEIQTKIKKEDWNDYHISAKGFEFTHRINGVLTAQCTDDDAEMRRATGILALQLHAGPAMKVQFRNIRVKKLDAETTAADAAEGSACEVSEKKNELANDDAKKNGKSKKIVFVAGNPSHGYGSHEHYAGCLLLAKSLNAIAGIKTEVVQNGWPKDESVFAGVDAVVMYADGGGRHPVIPHSEAMDKMADAGVGIVCIHYGVEVPKGEPGDYFLKWIGGDFEPHWSVNPHWNAKFEKFPEHPTTRGVKPFEAHDEWYYHMRFREDMKGVTPILTDMPGKETLSRPDGAHSGNPHVRAAVLNRKEPQHVAWASERPNGGRGFGFTGGHNHWNWGEPNLRKLVLNAIVWAAHGEVPQNGIGDAPVSFEQLEENQDEKQPDNFNPEATRSRFHLTSVPGLGEKNSGVKKQAKRSRGPAPKPKFSTAVVTPKTPGHAAKIDVDISGAKQLFLVVTDGGNGYSCDWADWAEPRLIGPVGEKNLTDLTWKSASSGFGQVRIGKNTNGGPLRIAGKSVEFGIGTHANSLIAYDLPAGYTRFTARGGLDNGGTDQAACGGGSSVQFQVFTERPRLTLVAQNNGGGQASHEAEDAVDQLEVHDGLDVSLFAAEPIMLNPTNIDIDHLGRIWVCEVVNYRLFANKKERKEGDRILILEDTDHDGKADKARTFYQGRDVDSAHGICVMPTPSGKGTRAIVSAKDSVFYLIDDDGDLKADRKELLFTGISGTEHDHGIHAFVFGPDGKLYFNFGNAGKQIRDRNGKPIIDLAGNEVNDRRKPYQQGMVFRCNLDGSEFETLGWNFRNNWEVTVDSFGTLWQSDNDDDGNRGTRINFVMEFGNYGYTDEFTGAGWKTARLGMHEEIPKRHWHLNDPGVVPNLLQTGAGSPTGICVYEGTLLPKVFQGQLLHTDAGPNVCRAYPAKSDGAGYAAESLNVLLGAGNKWFRPSDVCVAPDGSVLVADWYDPGVGGHRMGDVEHGRLFRLTPKGHDGKYVVPKQDFESLEGLLAALNNPSTAVRTMAWTALHKQGVRAESKLLQQFKSSDDARARARALWLLGKIEGRGAHYAELALGDQDSDIRIVGLRLARQLKLDVIPFAKRLVRDASPQVRREIAVAIRHNKSADVPGLWAELAEQYDGKDRWYLEALGIAADRQWDACLAAWLKKTGDGWSTLAGRDIIWRSRAKQTPQLLAKIVTDPKTPAETHPRYMRAFDFLSGPEKDQALKAILLGLQLDMLQRILLIVAVSALAVSANAEPSDAQAAKDAILVQTILRLKGIDVDGTPKLKAAALRHLKTLEGKPEYVDLAKKLKVRGVEAELLRLATSRSDSTEGVNAAELLLDFQEAARIKAVILGKDAEQAANMVAALGRVGSSQALGLIQPLVTDRQHSRAVRSSAAAAIGRNLIGQRYLLERVVAGEIPDDVKFAVANALFASPDKKIREAAAIHLVLPVAAKGISLPPVAELVKQTGDAARGQQLFKTTATCIKCHKVRGEGKEVGPDLSEIGSKLSQDAMFISILDPSAGISHNYESYTAILASGNLVTGVVVSRTDDQITLRNAEAIDKTYQMSDVDELIKSDVSIMPADLQKTMTARDLVDVVAYIASLKKAGS